MFCGKNIMGTTAAASIRSWTERITEDVSARANQAQAEPDPPHVALQHYGF